MVTQTTDFYLNLDRWGSLSAVERDRGRWEARLHGPTARLETVRREAILAAVLGVLPEEIRANPKLPEILIAEKPPEDTTSIVSQAWRYGRAIQFIHGWYEAFPWTGAGVAQVCRLLEIPMEEMETSGAADLLALQLQAALVGRQSGGVPLLEISAFYGSIRNAVLTRNADSHLYFIALRLMLLQKGYVQVLFGSIEPDWFRMPADGSVPVTEPTDTEEQLGAWLDQVVELLIEVGRRAEASWIASQTLASRSALQEAILAIAHRNGRVTAGDVLRTTGANRNTIKDNLTRLVMAGVLRKQGHKRGTVYFLPS
jgi:hypothetical protein